ncbi:photosynthetic NDH subunit of lumenal location 1, chloroplastic-like isoform X2 [Silene latifolia]|uniref:photosynthetic NDH subunit of lumenal location 1, chloroplastic-like isoform X2 n=2 Tax=Silene latifolia TaxID=37657 RepID=UPI003D783878
MAASSFSLSLAPAILYHKVSSCNNRITCSNISSLPHQRYCDRRSLMMAAGMLALSFISPQTALAQEVPQNYRAFIDKADGYSYVYPSDWRDFEFRAHDSAFKDRYLQLQNVRLSFLPTDKQDIHDLGPMEDVVRDLVKNIYAAPNQVAYIKEMQERSDNGKNYYTVEYQLTSPNFSVTRFSTLAIANGRFYTLTVGANERRWKRVRNKLKVVADSLQVFDI